jgi:hypothetical protein
MCSPMESSYAPPLKISRWRRATIVVSLLAVVELVALLAIGIAFLGKSVANHVEAAAAAQVAAPIRKQAAKTKPGAPRLTRGSTDVLVLNGNGVAGAAGTAADRLRALGYLIGGVGNAPATGTTKTLVMFRDGYRAEAVRLAKDLGARIVTPLDGMAPGQLMGAQLVLVLGS